MTKLFKVGSLAVAIVGLAACNTMSDRDYMVESSADDDYVYIVDYEKIALIEAAGKASHSNVDTYWVNPPVKRIPRSEYERLKKGQ